MSIVGIIVFSEGSPLLASGVGIDFSGGHFYCTSITPSETHAVGKFRGRF